MGTIIAFPEGQQMTRMREPVAGGEPAAVIILPVIRIERFPEAAAETPQSSAPPVRRRRRRNSRS
jgi:hypothetical protein